MIVKKKLIVLSVAYASLLACITNSAAQDATANAKLTDHTATKDTLTRLVWFGAEYGELGKLGYAGTVISLNNDIEKSGYLLRLATATGQFNYMSSGTDTQLDSLSGEVMVGYNFVKPKSTTSIFAGLDFQDSEATPNDPLNTSLGQITGFKVQGEVGGSISDDTYASVLGSFSTANDSYYIQAQSTTRFDNGLHFGPSLAFLGSTQYESRKVSLNFGGLNLGDVNITMNVGMQFNSGENSSRGAFIGFSGSFLH